MITKPDHKITKNLGVFAPKPNGIDAGNWQGSVKELIAICRDNNSAELHALECRATMAARGLTFEQFTAGTYALEDILDHLHMLTLEDIRDLTHCNRAVCYTESNTAAIYWLLTLLDSYSDAYDIRSAIAELNRYAAVRNDFATLRISNAEVCKIIENHKI